MVSINVTFEQAERLGWTYGLPANLTGVIGQYWSGQEKEALQAYVAFCFNSDHVPNMFNMALYASTAVIVMIAFLANHSQLLVPSSLRHSHRRLGRWCERHVLLASTVPSGAALEPIPLAGKSKWTSVQVPTRIHTVVVTAYVVANLAVLFGFYWILASSIFYTEDTKLHLHQYLRHFSDRAGILSFGSTPLVVLLAARNSPISYITGASFATLQIYHRWVARVTFLTAFLHGVGYAAMVIYDGRAVKKALTKTYWLWGYTAIFGGLVLCVGSLRRLRELSYEVFLFLHIFGSLLWVVGCWWHVWLLRKKHLYLFYVYLAVGAWASDRIVRRLRSYWVGWSRREEGFNTYGTLIGDGTTYFRLKITAPPSWTLKTLGPGSYIFITLPKPQEITQSHPFTVAWAEHTSGGKHAKNSEDSSDVDQEDQDALDLTPLVRRSGSRDESGSPLVFDLVCKACDGFTRQIIDSIEPGDGTPFDVLIEGPYGSASDFRGFDTILLVAGGTGIAGTIAHIAHLTRHHPSSRVLNMKIVWAIRRVDAVELLLPYLVKISQITQHNPKFTIDLQIHYTRAQFVANYGSSPPSSTPITEIRHRLLSLPPHYQHKVTSGRPNVRHHLEELIDELSENVKHAVAVSACGPAPLCDASREAVRSLLAEMDPDSDLDLEYSEELFTW